MQFVKMHGLGNDFVLVDCLETDAPPEDSIDALSQAVCDRHFGIGSDGLIFILPADDADYRMRIFNSDGSESEMCGNGIRCFAKYLYDANRVGAQAFSIATGQGLQHIEILDEGNGRGARDLPVRVDMGSPRLMRSQIPMLSPSGNGADSQVISESLEVDGAIHKITAISMGNPHCVIFVDDVESVELKEIGFKIEHHHAFPQRTNVHFVQVMGPHKLWMRTWERGAGDTLACGTGACAVVVAAVLNGRLSNTDRRALVHLPGGDLEIEWSSNNHVYMTGPATTVYAGELDLGSFEV